MPDLAKHIHFPNELHEVGKRRDEAIRELRNTLAHIPIAQLDDFNSTFRSRLSGQVFFQEALEHLRMHAANQTSVLEQALANIRLTTDLSRLQELVPDHLRLTADLLSQFQDANAELLGETSLPDSERVDLARKLLHPNNPQLVLAAEIVKEKAKSKDGQIIQVVSIPWFSIYEEILHEPNFLYQFARHPRKFEEFVAGAYDRQGWQVTLTPRSGDKGRDIIVERADIGALRLIEQCKAKSPENPVTREEVDELLGVLGYREIAASKAILTTTSTFAPGVLKDPGYQGLAPTRLELRGGLQLIDWLETIARREE